jgi:exopolysaccharide biosynthesis polyprenyl glycosylphosphotransferase
MVRTVRSLVARLTWLFDDAVALIVMLLTYTVMSVGRLPGGVQEFLAVRLTVRNVALALVFMVIWHSCFALCGLYQPRLWNQMWLGAVRIVAACGMAAAALSVFTLASRSGAFALDVVAYFWVAVVLTELVGRSALTAAGRYVERYTRELKHAVIVGSGPMALRVYDAIQARESKDCVVTGFVDSRSLDEMPSEVRSRLIGSLEEFESLLSRQPIDQVLIALPVKSNYAAIQRVVESCERVGVELKYFPDLFAVSRGRHAFDGEDEQPAMKLQLVVDDHRLMIKRALDLAGATCGLIALFPLCLACVLAIKFTSPGPIVFAQPRYGRNRRLFRMYKFRTMVQDAERLQGSLEAQNEAQGPVFKMRSDPRVTRVGRVMRRLSLDELPQLINVLKGDMSLVGPRPLPVRDVSRFSAPWLMRRFSVKPGLTCLWQVNGRSEMDFDHWVRLDLDYIDNWSLGLDMRILFKTVPVVLWGRGAM